VVEGPSSEKNQTYAEPENKNDEDVGCNQSV
jgi:hypothetical protein